MKISYINSICVKNDAISNAIRDEINWLSSEGGHDICLYGYDCEHSEIPFVKVNDIKDVVFNCHFQLSDLVVLHFGVYYPLFDIIPVTPLNAKKLVVFHNITPKEFIPKKDHSIIDRSFQQIPNISFSDHVICVSKTNLDVLRKKGVDTPASILPLAVHKDIDILEKKPSFTDNVIRILFVGRFVKSKGPNDLLEAMDTMLQNNPAINIELDMIGKLSFSDTEVVSKVHEMINVLHSSYVGRIKISMHGDALNTTKQEILNKADLFILPTYHEGFCVPIVEALSSGCKVITYENSNTPSISGGLAKLVPTGDVKGLTNAIIEGIEEVSAEDWRKHGYVKYSKIANAYVQQYQPEQVKEKFLNFIEDFMNN